MEAGVDHSPCSNGGVERKDAGLNLKEKLKGKFIVLDGPDGSGKGTQIRILKEYLLSEGVPVVSTIDPGGTAIGDRIRQLLKYGSEGIEVNTEVMLFMASRAQLVSEIIRPALKKGETVLCDRFVSSTCAYQGAGGYPVEKIISLARAAIGDIWPNLTIVLDLPVKEGRKRAGVERSRKVDNDFEQMHLFDSPTADHFDSRSLDYHRKVRKGFLCLAGKYPGKVEVLDVNDKAIEVVSENIKKIIVETVL